MNRSNDPTDQTAFWTDGGKPEGAASGAGCGESTDVTLPPSALTVVDRVCDEFESAWRAGQRPRIEDFVNRVPSSMADALFRELLEIELQFRRKAGEPTQATKHSAPFSDQGALGAVAGYELLGELGRGGMGVVYRARQVRANRDVALKMVLHGSHGGAAQMARFRAEAEAVARLQHPNIVAVYEVGESEGRPFFSMEFCAGGSLANATQTMSPRAAAELLLQVARGVAAAHAAGIIHRDLKPGNVLLTSEGIPKVADFGLAKQMEAAGASLEAGLTATGAVLGTPSYMAPEQAGSARRVGPPADVYSLGAILYELLTGQPPFRGPTVTDTLLLLLTEDVRPPRELRPDVPRDLEAICLRCLDKDQGRRYPNAAELSGDLVRFLNGDPVTASQSGLLDRLAGALDRVQLHERFSTYGSFLLALAPVMFITDAWLTTALLYDWPSHFLPLGQFGRVLAFIVLLGYFRGWRWLPQGPAERQLWAIWGGYLLACFLFGLSTRLALGLFDASLEPQLYQGFACLAALAFFALAPGFWGYCAVIGFGFLALPFLMAIDLRWAPVEFGAAWAGILILLGRRLRRLASPDANSAIRSALQHVD